MSTIYQALVELSKEKNINFIQKWGGKINTFPQRTNLDGQNIHLKKAPHH